MFKWLSNLFAAPPRPYDGWVEAPDLKVTIDFGTCEVGFGNNQFTALGQTMSSLAPLGPPDEHRSTDTYNYARHALYLTVKDDIIERISFEFMSMEFIEANLPSFLLNGSRAELTPKSSVSEVIALVGPPFAQEAEDIDGHAWARLEYRTGKGATSEWSFDDGRLMDVIMTNYGADEPDADAGEDEETW